MDLKGSTLSARPRRRLPGCAIILSIGAGAAISEPAHVASSDPSHGGWLLMVVDVPNGPPGMERPPHDYASELWIVEADEVEKGPVARVKTGLALRSQVHGAWVGRDRLEASRLKG